MKKVIIKFSDNTFFNAPADFIDIRDGMVIAWDGENMVAVAKLDAINCCYLSDKKEES